MQPTDGQLLKQLRKATAQLLGESSKPEHTALLGMMDVLLNELLLRDDHAFFVDYYQRGHGLLDQGLKLTGAKSDAIRTEFNRLSPTLDADLRMDVIGAQTIKLTGLIEQLVKLIGHTTDATQTAWHKQVSEWELGLFAHRMKKLPATDLSAVQSLDVNRDNLLVYLRQKKPEWKNLDITHFHRVAGGFSKITILFDTVDDVNGKQSLALRAEQPIFMLNLDGSDISNEFPVVKKAFESGIAVAEPLWLETGSNPLKTRFSVSRKVSGANFGTAVGGEGKLSPAAVKNLAREMARIHNIPLTLDDAWVKDCHFGKWLQHGSMRQTTLALIAYWQKQAKDANLYPHPIVARAINWLIANVPACEDPPVFLHADFGPHNVLLDGDRVSAALDWEVSMAGDPAYDVCWFLNCTGAAVDRQQFLDAYRDAGGKTISEYRLRYFDVVPCMFMPTTANAALRLVEDLDAAPINLAYYGLQFMHGSPSRINDLIAKADEVKHWQ